MKPETKETIARMTELALKFNTRDGHPEHMTEEQVASFSAKAMRLAETIEPLGGYQYSGDGIDAGLETIFDSGEVRMAVHVKGVQDAALIPFDRNESTAAVIGKIAWAAARLMRSETKAQRAATLRYRAEKVHQLNVAFYPKDEDLWDHVQAQPNKADYIRELIRRDMEI